MMKSTFTQTRWLVGSLVGLALLGAACATSTSTTSNAPAAEAPAVVATTAETSSEPAAAALTTTTTVTESAAVTAATVVTDIAAEAVESAPAAAMTKLNLNTVTGDELLATIPDFGNRMVREIEEYRPYISIQQFRQEIGKYVDEAQVATYEEYVYVPVAVNDSDAATIMQIPGVDQATADALIAARPYSDNAAFIVKLTEVAPAVDGTLAQAYLEAQ